MQKKTEIRPLYAELQGYLAQAPTARNSTDAIFDESVWTQYNQAVDSLSKISGEDYSHFRLEPTRSGDGGGYVRIVAYRQKLGGLVARLHGAYFSKETAPFSGSPKMIVAQTLRQDQSTVVAMLLGIQSKIDERISACEEGSKEHSFLQKLKNLLPSISNGVELLRQCLTLAREAGLSIGDLGKIFE